MSDLVCNIDKVITFIPEHYLFYICRLSQYEDCNIIGQGSVKISIRMNSDTIYFHGYFLEIFLIDSTIWIPITKSCSQPERPVHKIPNFMSSCNNNSVVYKCSGSDKLVSVVDKDRPWPFSGIGKALRQSGRMIDTRVSLSTCNTKGEILDS